MPWCLKCDQANQIIEHTRGSGGQQHRSLPVQQAMASQLYNKSHNFAYPIITVVIGIIQTTCHGLHYRKNLHRLRNCIIPNEETARAQDPRGCRSTMCWVGNYAISQWVWVLGFIQWLIEMRVRGCWKIVQLPYTPFLHWLWRRSWDNQLSHRTVHLTDMNALFEEVGLWK